MRTKSPRRWRIHLLALRDCTPIVPVGVADLLRKTIALAGGVPGVEAVPEVEVHLVSAGAERIVVAAGGLPVHCQSTLAQVRSSDLVIVPPIDPPDLLGRLEENAGAVRWLRRLYEGGADVASVCTGAFLLGEAGLLDGRRATTHWAFQELLRARYPKAQLEPEAIVVDQGRICTAGGATSFLNLTLYLVERIFGDAVARFASRMFLVDLNKSPQSAYAVFGAQKAHADREILKAQELIERGLRGTPSVEQLARQVAMSRRNFIRRFKAATGNAPLQYIQRVRIEAAKRALEDAAGSVAEIAERVGYQDGVAFRRLFVRETGLTPAEYRRRYGPRSAPAFVEPRRLLRAQAS